MTSAFRAPPHVACLVAAAHGRAEPPKGCGCTLIVSTRACHAHSPWFARARPQQSPPSTHRAVGVQRLAVLVAVMLARERRALADAEDGGCTELAAALPTLPSGTELAAALTTLPSGLLEIVGDAVVALGHADAGGTSWRSAGFQNCVPILRMDDFSHDDDDDDDLPERHATSLHGRRSVRSAACCLI